MEKRTYTYYHAGPLFTLAELHTNALLASRIKELSAATFVPKVPQDLEPRSLHPHDIRDSDLLALLSCDLALFTYDGPEIDSGTVVEYMVAKFADIPSVILRTDFRGAGDQNQNGKGKGNGNGNGNGSADSWNLMSSFWPRTKVVKVDSMEVFKLNGSSSAKLLDIVAEKCVLAMEEVVRMPSTMPKECRKDVLAWLKVMPGWRNNSTSTSSFEVDKMIDERMKKMEETDG